MLEIRNIHQTRNSIALYRKFRSQAMNEPPKRDALLAELDRERLIRRTVKLLRAKRSRIREDLHQLVSHLALLLPVTKVSDKDGDSTNAEVLVEAVKRLDDEIFTDLLIQIIQEKKNFNS